jgi:hypothetical protein
LSATLEENPKARKPRPASAELHRVLEEAVERDAGALIHLQRGVAATIENVMRRDLGADRQVNGVGEKAEGAITGLERPHERRPIEMRQEIDGADVGIDLGGARQRRQCRRVDTREPKIGGDQELVSARRGYVLSGCGTQSERNSGNIGGDRGNHLVGVVHLPLLLSRWVGPEP